jgi:homoserine/homoserine lactone efflux protein
VAGTQFGLAVIGIGLTSVIELMGHRFDMLRLIGEAYLVWLGWRMLRAEDCRTRDRALSASGRHDLT